MSTNLKMTRGDTRVVQVTLTNLTVNGLTGYKYWFTAKLDIADLDAAAVIKKVGQQAAPTGDFQTVTLGSDTTAGVITCEITPEDTEALPDYDVDLAYDVQVEDANGKVTTPVDGTLTVKPDKTRSR